MKYIKYIILFFILCNIPSYLKAYFGTTLGSASSYLSSLLLIFYFFFTREKHKPLIPFIALGLLYFTISGLNYSGVEIRFIKEFIRFMIVVVCGVEVVHRTQSKEIYYVLLIGALSIIINAVVFPLANANFYPTYGRFSGFYLNPNFAGSACLIGYALSYKMNNKWIRIFGQMAFTLGGIFTFSRAFIAIWVLINLISIYQSKKNIVVPIIGVFILSVLFLFSGELTLNTDRFSALESVFSSEKVQSNTITDDARTETWAQFMDIIMEKPFFGNGFMKLQGGHFDMVPGVHNSYLMVIGEAGIFPFLIMIGIYYYLVSKSVSFFKNKPHFFYLAMVLSIILLVGHGYFNDFYNVFVSMFLFVKIKDQINSLDTIDS